jgi:glycerate 2-kinase
VSVRPSVDTHRALLSALYEAAVQGAAPFERTRGAVSVWCDEHGKAPGVRVHVLALGKAAPAMLQGAVAALDARGITPTGGALVSHALPDTWVPPAGIRVALGDHPVPGPASLAAAESLEDAIADVATNDVVLVLLSGGTTALCAAPIPALSQAAGDAAAAQALVANLAQTLLEGGLAIHEMNAIRRRVLRFGAGRLATALHQRGAAHIATFAISDVIGDDEAVIGSGPCTPDPFDDATFLAVLDAHDLRSRLQREMSTVLGLAGSGTPPAVPPATHPAFAHTSYRIVARNALAVAEASRAASQHAVTSVMVDDTPLEGDAALLGEVLAQRAIALARQTPRGSRAVLLAGGEPVVDLHATMARAMEFGEDDDARLDADDAVARAEGFALPRRPSAADEPLKGGRMQVLALSAALALEAAAQRGHADAWRVRVLAAGTDGRDGPTDAAGAITDAATPGLARRHGRAPETDLATGRSYLALDAADALLRTGPTGTNVMDVVALLVTE